jgi:serine/threonine protein phosphatase PrpC
MRQESTARTQEFSRLARKKKMTYEERLAVLKDPGELNRIPEKEAMSLLEQHIIDVVRSPLWDDRSHVLKDQLKGVVDEMERYFEFQIPRAENGEIIVNQLLLSLQKEMTSVELKDHPELAEKLPYECEGESFASPKHPERNEDMVLYDPIRGIFAVFDGVGGSKAGEVASLLAYDEVKRFLTDRLPEKRVMSRVEAHGILLQTLERANTTIQENAALSTKTREGMGAAGTIMIHFRDVESGRDQWGIAHIGDTRAEVMNTKEKDPAMKSLTTDINPVGIEVFEVKKEIEKRKLSGKIPSAKLHERLEALEDLSDLMDNAVEPEHIDRIEELRKKLGIHTRKEKVKLNGKVIEKEKTIWETRGDIFGALGMMEVPKEGGLAMRENENCQVIFEDAGEGKIFGLETDGVTDNMTTQARKQVTLGGTLKEIATSIGSRVLDIMQNRSTERSKRDDASWILVRERKMEAPSKEKIEEKQKQKMNVMVKSAIDHVLLAHQTLGKQMEEPLSRRVASKTEISPAVRAVEEAALVEIRKQSQALESRPEYQLSLLEDFEDLLKQKRLDRMDKKDIGHVVSTLDSEMLFTKDSGLQDVLKECHRSGNYDHLNDFLREKRRLLTQQIVARTLPDMIVKKEWMTASVPEKDIPALTVVNELYDALQERRITIKQEQKEQIGVQRRQKTARPLLVDGEKRKFQPKNRESSTISERHAALGKPPESKSLGKRLASGIKKFFSSNA